MDNSTKTLVLGVSWGLLTYLLHETAHAVLGATAIEQVTIAMAVVAAAAIGISFILVDPDVSGTEDMDLPLIAVGAITLGIAHQLTHGSFVPDLAETSVLLAVFAFVGAFIDDIAYRMQN